MFGCIAIGILAATAGSHATLAPGGLFTYDGTSTEWSASGRALSFARGSHRPVLTNYLRVAGNFGGTVTVTGPAIGVSPPMLNAISIQSSQGFSVTARAFGPIASTNGPNPQVGAVQFQMALYSVSAGGRVLVAGPVQGTDAGFNGALLVAPATGGVVVTYELDIARAVTLTQLAMGGMTYRSSGYLDVVLQ